ncbi:MAG: hypothetical protein WD737_11900 [Gemmatimonadota bacterium]
MAEERTGEGGAANTPPFPRLVSDDERTTTGPEQEAASAAPSGEPDDESRVVAEAVARPVIHDAGAPASEAGPEASDSQRAAGTRSGGARARPRSSRTPAGDEGRPPRRGQGTGSFVHIAERLEEAAARLESLAATQLQGVGPSGQAADAAYQVSDAMDDVAGYLRSADLRALRNDLARQVQEKPLQTLLIAVGTGWLVGKIMR